MNLKDYIRDVPDFPKKGVIFKDITPLLSSNEAFSYTIDTLAKNLKDADVIVWLDARGFILASPIAYKLNKPLVIVRKTGKLPYKTLNKSYSLEYGEASLDIHIDSIKPWQKVALVDDVLATGGTMLSALELTRELWWEIHSCNFLMTLSFLPWEKALADYTCHSLITY